MEDQGHEHVVVHFEPATGLRAAIAVHSTALGPALGGCRLWPYPTFAAAADDALRLARAMTYKAAMAGLHLGGGKAVIMAPPAAKTPELLRAFGRFVDALAGLYITAEDVGITISDLEQVRHTTRYVTGLPEDQGGSGDPSIMTAAGVEAGIRRCLAVAFGSDRLDGRTVAIQGVGKVGAHLAQLLHAGGAALTVADVAGDRARAVAKSLRAKVVAPEQVYETKCDVFAPCALGGVLNARTIPKLRCQIVAGAANNQLERPDDAARLARRAILYAPDYVINAGGLINIACELEGYRRESALKRVSAIPDHLQQLFDRATRERITPSEAADRTVAERLAAARDGRPTAPPAR